MIIGAVEIELYRDERGREPVTDWLEGLDRPVRQLILVNILRVQSGNTSRCKDLGRGLYELKVGHGPGYRVYFYRKGAKLVVLLCGGDKSSQNSDIARARRFMARDRGKQMSKRRNLDQYLAELLKDPEEALAHLAAAFNDGDRDVILIAIGNVIKAREGVAEFADKTSMKRENLYRFIRGDGNPTLETFLEVVKVLGLKLQPEWQTKKRATR